MSSSNAPARTGPPSSKRPRYDTSTAPSGGLWGLLEAESTKNRKDLDGLGVPVADYLLDYKSKNENADVNLVARVLEGMTIRKSDGTNKNRRHPFKGLVVQDGKELPKLNLGLTATTQIPVLADISECAVYIKDNERNKRLRRIVSGDNLSETHYLENKHLHKKWQLLYLGQGNPVDTLKEFMRLVVDKWGDANGEVIYISNVAELGIQLSTHVDSENTQVLLCVMEKEKDDQFYRALKREAESEMSLMTKCCHMKIVNDNVIIGKDNTKGFKPTVALKHLVLEMVAKTGAYKDKAFFLNSAVPTQFRGEVMYLGYHVSSSNPPVTVMVGNMGASDRCAGEYQCSVGQEDYHMVGDMFAQLREKNSGRCSPKRIILFREGHVRKTVKGTLQEEVGDLRKVVGGAVRITLFVHQRLSCAIRYVRVREEKCSYSVYLDENGFSSSQLQMLIDNLSYSDRYRKPLPAIYANKAAKLAEIYLEGKNDELLDDEIPELDEVAEAIDRSLYVIGERDDTEDKGTRKAEAMEVENN